MGFRAPLGCSRPAHSCGCGRSDRPSACLTRAQHDSLDKEKQTSRIRRPAFWMNRLRARIVVYWQCSWCLGAVLCTVMANACVMAPISYPYNLSSLHSYSVFSRIRTPTAEWESRYGTLMLFFDAELTDAVISHQAYCEEEYLHTSCFLLFDPKFYLTSGRVGTKVWCSHVVL